MTSIFSSVLTDTLTAQSFIICLAAALVIGALLALMYGRAGNESKGFLTTIALIPAIVSVIIMMVSGSLGASVAVAGTFSLVRFRSNPGTAREICALFLAMAVGLGCGMGYPVFSAIFAIIIGIVTMLYDHVNFGGVSNAPKQLKITVPEDLNYSGAFDDLFDKYTSSATLAAVKTTNLGSLNRLTYDIILKTPGSEKDFIDELRQRNGNLEISISLPTAASAL